MKQLIQITTIEEYNYCKKRGFEPLFDLRFDLFFSLRKEIQNSLFYGSTAEKNDKYYHWNWENKNQQCQECLRPLHNYSSVYVSHILSRKQEPAMAHDPRNCNILCDTHHKQWENEFKRKEMRIYESNLKIIELLKNEYRAKTHY